MIIPGAESEVPSPEQVAAWWALDWLEPDRVPWWAAEWLVQGWDGPMLRELAGLGAEDRWEILEMVPSVLHELAVPLPATLVDAAEVTFRYLARLCLQGLVEERRVAWAVDQVLDAVSYVDEVYALPLSGAFGIDDVWDDGFSGSAIELRELVRDACVAQLAARPAPGSG